MSGGEGWGGGGRLQTTFMCSVLLFPLISLKKVISIASIREQRGRTIYTLRTCPFAKYIKYIINLIRCYGNVFPVPAREPWESISFNPFNFLFPEDLLRLATVQALLYFRFSLRVSHATQSHISTYQVLQSVYSVYQFLLAHLDTPQHGQQNANTFRVGTP